MNEIDVNGSSDAGAAEQLLRQRLHALADHAPTQLAVQLPDLPMATPKSSSRRRRRVGLGVSVAALLGAAGITTVSLAGGSPGGAGDPERAVMEMVSAIEDGDVLGVLDIVDPAERRALQRALEAADDDGQRLGLLADTFSLSAVTGVEVLVQGLELETEQLDRDIAVVHATGGFVRASLERERLAIGSAIDDAVVTDDDAVRVDFDEVDVVGGGGPFVATVERDGRWYVSVSFTIAEYARRAAGVQPAEPGAAVPAEGFATAQAAAEAFMQRVTALDWRGLVATAAPGEGDALARYAPLWLGAAGEAAAGAQAAGLVLTLRDAVWDVQEDGDHAVASLASYVLEGSVPPGTYTSDDAEYAPFDPALATVVQLSAEGLVILIPAGQPVPDVVTAEMERTSWSEIDDMTNIAYAEADGVVVPQWDTDVSPPSDGPVPFTLVNDGTCSTITGPLAEEMSEGEMLLVSVTRVDGGLRYCSSSGDSLFLFSVLAASPASPPSLTLVRQDGQWYVSPLGSALGVITDSLSALEDGAFEFDGSLGWVVYRGYGREELEDTFSESSRDGLTEQCQQVSEFDSDDYFVKLVDDPSPVALLACIDAEFID